MVKHIGLLEPLYESRQIGSEKQRVPFVHPITF